MNKKKILIILMGLLFVFGCAYTKQRDSIDLPTEPTLDKPYPESTSNTN